MKKIENTPDDLEKFANDLSGLPTSDDIKTLFMQELRKKLERNAKELEEAAEHSDNKRAGISRSLFQLTEEINEDKRTIPIKDKVQEAYNKLIEISKEAGYKEQPVYLEKLFVDKIMSHVYEQYMLKEYKELANIHIHMVPSQLKEKLRIALEQGKDLINELDIEGGIFKKALTENIFHGSIYPLILDQQNIIKKNSAEAKMKFSESLPF